MVLEDLSMDEIKSEMRAAYDEYSWLQIAAAAIFGPLGALALFAHYVFVVGGI